MKVLLLMIISLPHSAPDAAFELLRKLVGDEKMLTVKLAMGF